MSLFILWTTYTLDGRSTRHEGAAIAGRQPPIIEIHANIAAFDVDGLGLKSERRP
jgi:hypothetical protein